MAAVAELGDEAGEEVVDQGDVEYDSDAAAADLDPGNNYFSVMRKDEYGLDDIDREFKFPDGRDTNIKKPAGWRRAVKYAGEVLINEMRRSMYAYCVYTSARVAITASWRFSMCACMCVRVFSTTWNTP